MMKSKSLASVVSLLTLAAAATALQPEKAGAVALSFATRDTVLDTSTTSTNFGNFNLGPGITSNVIHYQNVAAGVDAVVTAGVFGTGYTFTENIYNYSNKVATTAVPNPPKGDAAFLYKSGAAPAAGTTAVGGMTYTINFYSTTGGVHDYSTAYVAPALEFLVYDVDGESSQSEAVRINKGTGLVGYQVGNSSAALTASEETNSFLFSGRSVNQAETDSSSAVILYYENVSSLMFQFEAVTNSTSSANNYVFSGVDGNLSILAGDFSGFATRVDTSATAVPEPFTIIGTIMGGTAAMRMRKKLKSNDKV
jgi:hypothetical protein